MMGFNIGDKVMFGRSHGEQTEGTVVGTVRSRTPKYKVRHDVARGVHQVGSVWTVPESLMRSSTVAAPVLKYTIGQRVTVLYFRNTFVGKITDYMPNIQKYEVFAGGSTLRYKEDEIQPFTGKRTEAEILKDFRSAYCQMSPENLWQDGEASRSHVRARTAELNRWIRELTTELGRKVSEDEAYRAAY